MRIELDDATRAPTLRDYFLRLGAQVVLNVDSTLEVEFDDEDLHVEPFLDSWTETNGLGARAIRAQAVPVLTARPEVAPRGPSPSDPPVRLGDLMVSKGFITSEQLAQALAESRASGELVGRVLLRNRWVFEDELARTLAEQWQLPYVRLASVGVDQQVMQLLPRPVGLSAGAVPVRFMTQSIQVAFADPSDPDALATVRSFLPSISLAVAEFSDIRTLWQSVAA